MRPWLALFSLFPFAMFVRAEEPKIDDPLGHWAEKIHDENEKVRCQAVIELGKLGPKSKVAVPTIAYALQNDKSAFVRLAAAGVLGQIGPDAKEAVPILIGALKDQGHDVASWSATALGKIGPEAKAAVPELIQFLRSHISTHAYTSAVALGNIGPNAKEAIPQLLDVVEKNPHQIAQDAAEALWKINKHKSAIPSLIRMLKDATKYDAGRVAECLGRIGPDAKEAVPQLEHTLRNQGSLVANRAALAIWQVARHKDAIPKLIELLTHQSSTERYHAAWRLAFIGPDAKEAVPALIQALRDDALYVAPAASDALKKIDPVAAKQAGVK